MAATVLVTMVVADRWRAPHTVDIDAPSAAMASGKSIAVLPFENLSSEKDAAYFASGMQDTILSKLAGIDELKVISRTSTAKFASHPASLTAIAAELGVDNVLEGSVQKSGNQVMVNVQLIDARNDRQLWAAVYRRNLDNVFDVEGEVAQQVTEALHARLSVAEQHQVAARLTANAGAYDAYLRGLAYDQHGGRRADDAIVALEQATRLDPGFVQAWSWLSRDRAQL